MLVGNFIFQLLDSLFMLRQLSFRLGIKSRRRPDRLPLLVGEDLLGLLSQSLVHDHLASVVIHQLPQHFPPLSEPVLERLLLIVHRMAIQDLVKASDSFDPLDVRGVLMARYEALFDQSIDCFGALVKHSVEQTLLLGALSVEVVR